MISRFLDKLYIRKVNLSVTVGSFIISPFVALLCVHGRNITLNYSEIVSIGFAIVLFGLSINIFVKMIIALVSLQFYKGDLVELLDRYLQD